MMKFKSGSGENMDVVDILKDLVSFNTIKDKENEKIINYIEKILKSIGFKTECKKKYLIMSYGLNTNLAFVGHTDTVEFIDTWNTNPFKLTKKDDKLYGLGSCDMKSGIASFIKALMDTDLTRLNYGIKVFFTYSEEQNFEGIKEIISDGNTFPKYILVGEPTNNIALTGCKGLLSYELNFNGIKVHSSNPLKGKSANSSCINFLYELEKFYNEKIKNDKNTKYEIPFTTMNIGILNGGSAINSVSAHCKATLDFRIAKDEHIDILKNIINKLSIKYDCKANIIQEIKAWYNQIDFINNIDTANYFTEASMIEGQRIILGAGPVTAHEVNEFITLKSLNKLVKQYKKIINQTCINL